MSEWATRVSDHTVHEVLSALRETLRNESLVSEDLTVNAIIERFTSAVAYTEVSMGSVIPSICDVAILNHIEAVLTAMQNGVTAYLESDNVSNINNSVLNQKIDSLSVHLSQLPIPRPDLGLKAFTASAVAYHDQTNLFIDGLDARKNALEGLIEGLEARGSEQDIQLTALSDTVSDVSVVVEGLVEKYEGAVKQISDRNEVEVDEFIEASRVDHSALGDELKAAADNIIAQLEEKRKAAAKLLGIIGNIGLTGNYQGIADKEGEAANRWRKVSLLFLGLMVGAILFAAFSERAPGDEVSHIILRFFAAAILSIPAVYAARESTRHRINEMYNRNTELQLATLGPYLDSIEGGGDPSDQVKLDLVGSFFGNAAALARNGHSSEFPNPLGLAEKALNRSS